MSERPMTPLDELLRLAAAGKPIFPCKLTEDGKKPPLTKNGHHDATCDAAQIRRWFNNHPGCLWGMPTGAPSGIAILDIDCKNGKNGFAHVPNRDRLSPVRVRTMSHGLHLYFKHDGRLRCSTNSEGVDVRGDGGYVIIPPSVGYAWDEGDMLSAELPEWPDELRKWADEQREARPVKGGRGVEQARIEAALAAISPACTYDEWYRVGAALFQALGEDGWELYDRWSAGSSSQYKPSECWAQWRAGQGLDRITAGTIFHLATKADPEWEGRHTAGKVAAGKLASVMSLKILEANGETHYAITAHDQTFTVTPETILSQNRFEAAFLAHTRHLPPTMKMREWKQAVAALVQAAPVEDVPFDATAEGKTFDALEDFLVNGWQAGKPDDMYRGKPWLDDECEWDEEKRFYFRLRDYRDQLFRSGLKQIAEEPGAKLADRLRRMGAQPEKLKWVKGKPMRLWSMPAHIVKGDPELSAPEFSNKSPI